MQGEQHALLWPALGFINAHARRARLLPLATGVIRRIMPLSPYTTPLKTLSRVSSLHCASCCFPSYLCYVLFLKLLRCIACTLSRLRGGTNAFYTSHTTHVRSSVMLRMKSETFSIHIDIREGRKGVQLS